MVQPLFVSAACSLRRALIGLALLLAAVANASAQPEASEYEVKAAFLLNFAKYVEWPPEALASSADPLRVCLLGDDPFGAALDELVGSPADSRPLTLHRLHSAAAAHDCHIVFIKHSRRDAVQRDLAQLRNSAVLTVGESDYFLDDGGIIAFRIEQDRVRLSINLTAAKQARLKISSRLLGLAKVVE